MLHKEVKLNLKEEILMNINCSTISLSLARTANQTKIKLAGSQSNFSLESLSSEQFSSKIAQYSSIKTNESYHQTDIFDCQASILSDGNQFLMSRVNNMDNYGLLKYPRNQYELTGSNQYTSLECGNFTKTGITELCFKAQNLMDFSMGNSPVNNIITGQWNVMINYLETPLISDTGYSGEQHRGVSMGTVTICADNHTYLSGISSFIHTARRDPPSVNHPDWVTYTTNVGKKDPVVDVIYNDINLYKASLDFDPRQAGEIEEGISGFYQFQDLQDGLTPAEIQQGRVLQSYLKYCGMNIDTEIKLEKCNGQARWALYQNCEASPYRNNSYSVSNLIGYATLQSTGLNCDPLSNDGISFTAEGLFKCLDGTQSPFGVRFDLDNDFISNNHINPESVHSPKEPLEIPWESQLDSLCSNSQFIFKLSWENYQDIRDITRKDIIPETEHHTKGSIQAESGKLAKVLHDKLSETYHFHNRYSFEEIIRLREQRQLEKKEEMKVGNEGIV
jgi:hypothetical protein